jgi:LacI family transcriptional regulator
MITIKEIAKAAGVSPSTVSNALNGKPNVSEKVRERIFALCEEMNYQPNPASKGLKSGKSKTLLFVFSDFDRQFYLQIIKGINQYTNLRGYDLLVCSSKSCTKFMHPSITCGSIILDRRIQNQLILQRASLNYPIISLDRPLIHQGAKSILLDNYSVMSELVEGLYQRGYRKFAFLAGVEATLDNQERYKATVDVLQSHGLKIAPEHHLHGDYTEQSGYQAAKILLLSNQLPEIVISANDDMAFGMIEAFEETGLRIPEDIAVTGFDDEKPAEALGLTTISVPNFERGYLATQHLINCISGEGDYSPVTINATVKWRFGTTQEILPH